jgi:acyl dehydratase
MSQPTVVPDIAALKDYVDRPLGKTEWETISQEQIAAFADATGDHQWIHVDVERARKESPFGGPIAHGYLTLSLVPKLLAQLLEVEQMANVVNSGIEKLRLTSAVPAGARVRLGAEIKNVRDLPTGGSRVVLAITVEVEGAAKPALTGRVVYLYFP